MSESQSLPSLNRKPSQHQQPLRLRRQRRHLLATRCFWWTFSIACGIFFGILTDVITPFQVPVLKHLERSKPAQSTLPLGVHVDSCRKSWSPPIGQWNEMVPNEYSGPELHNVAIASFDIPASSASVFIISNSTKLHGSVELNHHRTADPGSTNIHINILAYYHDEGVIKGVHPCTLKRNPKENGIGILVDQDWPLPYPGSLNMSITMWSPPRITLSSFETDLPNFQHVLKSSHEWDEIQIDNLSVQTSNAKVDAHVITNRASLITTNAPISGFYTARTELKLHTTNAPIDAFLDLRHEVEFYGNTTADLKTQNGKITARGQLVKSHPGQAHFSLQAQTENSEAEMTIQGASGGSSIWIDARSSNAPVTVNAPEVYGGAFYLGTTQFKPSISGYNLTNDRLRDLVFYIDENSVAGETFLGNKRDECEGNIHIESTNAPVSLFLDWSTQPGTVIKYYSSEPTPSCLGLQPDPTESPVTKVVSPVPES